ncbi:MAG: pyridoxal 5'-phosphate synthase glutaminase subunit PdxT [Deltaproteobacteria bacterium]|nr:pyridoxal 5'-phosphate synthase glutaminase subunit PdxT [Deltaproteobacteria bacterium]
MTHKTIGVLALQGGYEAHANVLRALGSEVRFVKTPDDLVGLDGLVFPGGESSTMLKLIDWSGLWGPLDAFVRSGKPVLATCAGLILSAARVTGPEQRSFGWLDVDVARNAWGRQVESFEARDDQDTTDLVFIRAPRITRVGPGVDVLATFRGEPIAVRSGAVVGASFHPELSATPTYHRSLLLSAPEANAGSTRVRRPPKRDRPP